MAAMPSHLWQASAAQLGDAYAAGDVSPVQVVDMVFDRMERVNPHINAVVTPDRPGARKAARDSEERWRAGMSLGRLDGIPLTVKDNILSRGLRATWGSQIFADFVPQEDELPIARLRAAGAIVIGKTNCPEFTLQGYTGNAIFGVTRNPWNLELTPGGSSGGGAAAVAAGIAPIAIGTDGGGSIRRPASHTGLVGLKPSRGRVPRAGGFPAILLDFETLGPMARTVADIVLVMEVLSEPHFSDPVSMALSGRGFQVGYQTPLRILYVARFGDAPVDPEVTNIVAQAARRVADLGHLVKEGDAPFATDAVDAAWPPISQVGLAWLLRSCEGGAERLTPAIGQVARAGAEVPATTYFEAISATRAVEKELAALFQEVDLLMTPTAAALPWAAAEVYPTTIAGEDVGPRGHAVFTAFVNMTGCAGINIPCGFSEDGLPTGFQLIGPVGSDGLLCGVAAEYEARYPWVDRYPAAELFGT